MAVSSELIADWASSRLDRLVSESWSLSVVVEAIPKIIRASLARYEFRLGETEVDSAISDLRLNLNSIDQGLDETIKLSQELDDIKSRL